MRELDSLAKAVVAEATQKGLTLATAESLTAGLIAATIADVPGASKVLLGGVVSYALVVKQAVLHVQGIDEQTVVSADCAKQMAQGVQTLTSADIAVSCTGVAGPGGGSDQTPVGTVFIGCAYGDTVLAEEHHFSGNRQAVRWATVRQTLQILMNCMKGRQSYGG